ncbi:hypothetical protein [Tsuneonella sp. HG222]
MTARTELPEEVKTASAKAASLDVLQVIYEHNLIRSRLIQTLLPQRHARGVLNTLMILKNARLITRITIDRYDPDVYMITSEGEDFLFKHRGRPDVAVNFYRPREDYRIEFDHKLGISQTIGNVRAGLMETTARFIPHGEITRLAGIPDDVPLKLRVEGGCMIKGQWRALPPKSYIEPDGIFGVEYAPGQANYFALEYQRTGKVRSDTLVGVSSMRKKYVGYGDIIINKRFKEWGIANLAVLSVFTEEKDLTASLKLCGEMHPIEQYPTGARPFYHTLQLPFRLTENGYSRAALPNPDLATDKWQRVGCDDRAIYEKGPAV